MNEQEQIELNKIASTDHEIFALLKQRYSPRIFEDKNISDAHLKQLFEAARWSASSFNRQPWRFIYAKKGSDAYDKLIDCLTDSNQKWAVNAPVLLLSVYKEKSDKGKNNFHALHDLGLSLGNMTVQAQYMHIALHHMAGIDREKAQNQFEVPEGFQVVSAIAIGYYGGVFDDLPKDLQTKETSERSRITQDEFAFQNAWQKNLTY